MAKGLHGGLIVWVGAAVLLRALSVAAAGPRTGSVEGRAASTREAGQSDAESSQVAWGLHLVTAMCFPGLWLLLGIIMRAGRGRPGYYKLAGALALVLVLLPVGMWTNAENMQHAAGHARARLAFASITTFWIVVTALSLGVMCAVALVFAARGGDWQADRTAGKETSAAGSADADGEAGGAKSWILCGVVWVLGILGFSTCGITGLVGLGLGLWLLWRARGGRLGRELRAGIMAGMIFSGLSVGCGAFFAFGEWTHRAIVDEAFRLFGQR